jgi:molybdenum cofactor biosynthesis enzyme
VSTMRFLFLRARTRAEESDAVSSSRTLRVCKTHCISQQRRTVNTLPRQRKIVGGVIFYAVHVVSKESRLLVLTKFLVLILNNAGTGMEFEVLTSVSIQILVVRLMRPFSLVGKYECFGGT